MISRLFTRFTHRLYALWTFVGMGGSVFALMLYSRQARADMNLIEAFLKGTDLDCVRLWFEGFCVWFVIKIKFLSVDVSIDFTPRISHYSPDAMLATTGRLGTSPSTEMELLYSQLELVISKPMVEIISGHGVPEAYNDERISQSKAADSGKGAARDTYNYSEVQIVGSPGNIFTLHQEGFGSLATIPVNAVQGATGTITAMTGMPQIVQSTLQQVAPAATGNVDSLSETANSATGDEATIFEQWQESDFGPTQFAELVLGPEVVQYLGAAVDIYDAMDAADWDITDAIDTTLEDATDQIDESVQEISDIMGDVNDFLDDDEDVQNGADIDPNDVDTNLSDGEAANVVSQLTAEILSVGIEALADELAQSIEDTLEDVAELMEQLEDIQQLVDSIVSQGGGGVNIHKFKSFCPRETQIFKPYFMSGTDVIAWRWRLPELVFPQTYYPAMKITRDGVGLIDTTVFNVGAYQRNGKKLFGELEIPSYNHWGPIYPRAGGVLQSNVIKARAVAASRAMHVITRPGQTHIYWNFPNSGDDGDPLEERKYWRYDYFPQSFNPQDERTGSWQLLDGGEDGGEHSCMRFGDNDDLLPTIQMTETTVPDPDNPGEEVSQFSINGGGYNSAVSSKDTRLLYNVWRKYECCQDPDPPNGWARYLFNVDIPLEIPL